MYSARVVATHPPMDGPNRKMEDVMVEAIQGDESLTKIVGRGVCQSDLYCAVMPESVFPYPGILGHEDLLLSLSWLRTKGTADQEETKRKTMWEPGIL